MIIKAINSLEQILKENNDLPVIAWTEKNNSVIISKRNRAKSDSHPLLHAELRCMLESDFHGDGLDLHSTLEPCSMCIAAAIHYRIKTITYYCRDPLAGAATQIPKIKWYSANWPKVEFIEDYEKIIANILINYMKKNNRWNKHLDIFKSLLIT